jgi:hypothetical protein
MKTRGFSLVLMTGVVALTTPPATADDDYRRYSRWHREQIEAEEEWRERQEELAEERREWEEERREAAERYQRRQRELLKEEREWRRDAGYYQSYRPVYPEHSPIYRSSPQYYRGRIYRSPHGEIYYHQGPSAFHAGPPYDSPHYVEPPVDHHGGYNPRASAIGARIGSRIGGAIGGAEGAAIGGRLGAEIGGEID